MSAFMCSAETIKSIAWYIKTKLDEHVSDEYPGAKIFADCKSIYSNEYYVSAIYSKLWQFNVEALRNRYGESAEEMFPEEPNPGYVNPFRPSKATPAFLKSLHCYIYQCSDIDYDTEGLLKYLEELAGRIAVEIVTSMPEYEEAIWG